MTWYRQSINLWWQVQSQNRHPPHDLPQAWFGKQTHVSILDVAQRKFAITPTYKYQDQWVPIQLMQKHRSKINKWIIGLWTWKIFYINQNNQLMLTIINNQLENSSRPCSNLTGKKILMSSLDMSNRKVIITPKYKYQYQWPLTWSMQTNKSTISYGLIKTKNLK